MLIGVRNNILTGGIIFTLVVFVLLGYTAWNLLENSFTPGELEFSGSHSWWFIYNSKVNHSFYMGLWSILGLLLIITIWGFILKNTFRKTSSPEIFFIAVFLFSCAFEGFRIFNLLAHINRIPFYFGIFLVRIVYFGRFLGAVSLLFASLFAMDFKYRKYGTILGVGTAICVILAYILPMDPTIFLSNYLFRLGDEGGLFLIFITCGFFCILNFIIAGIRKQRAYWGIALGSLLVLAGRDLIFFLNYSYWFIPGLLLLILGIVIINRQVDKIYFWG